MIIAITYCMVMTGRTMLGSSNNSDWQLPVTLCIAIVVGTWGLVRVTAGIVFIVSSRRIGNNFDYPKTREWTTGFFSVFSRLVAANPDARWDQWLTSETMRRDVSKMYDNTVTLKKLHSPTSFGQNSGDLYKPKKLDEVVNYIDSHKDCLWFTNMKQRWEDLLAQTVADVTSAYAMLAAVEPSLTIGYRYWGEVSSRHSPDENETDVTNYYGSGCCNRYMPWKNLLAVLAWKQQDCKHYALPLQGDITGCTSSFEYQEIPTTVAVRTLMRVQWLTSIPVGMMLLQIALLISTPITYNKFGSKWRVYEIAMSVYIVISVFACYIVDAYTSYRMLALRIVDNSIKFVANAVDPVFEQSNVPKHIEKGWNREGPAHIREWISEAEENAQNIPKIHESQQIASTTTTALLAATIGLQAIAMASSTEEKDVVSAVLALIVTLIATAAAAFTGCIINMVLSLRALARQVELHKFLLASNPYVKQSEELKATYTPMTENESNYIKFQNIYMKKDNDIGSIEWYNEISGLTSFKAFKRCAELSLLWEWKELFNLIRKALFSRNENKLLEEMTNSVREMLRRCLCTTSSYITTNAISTEKREIDALLWNRIFSNNHKLKDKVQEVKDEEWYDQNGIMANIAVLNVTLDEQQQEIFQEYTFEEYGDQIEQFNNVIVSTSVELLRMLYRDADVGELLNDNNVSRQQEYLARTSSINMEN